MAEAAQGTLGWGLAFSFPPLSRVHSINTFAAATSRSAGSVLRVFSLLTPTVIRDPAVQTHLRNPLRLRAAEERAALRGTPRMFTQSRARDPTLRATLIFSAWTKRNLHPSGPQYPDPMAPARPRLCFFQGNRFEGGKQRMGRNLYFQRFLAERVCVLALD